MNWLVSQGLTGLPENEVLRGFCERCRAEGLDLSRGLVFIDTLHPIYEGRGFRWNDVETNESDTFEYVSSNDGDAAKNWRRSTFFHMLERGHDEIRIDLADCASLDFSMIDELAAHGLCMRVEDAPASGRCRLTSGQQSCCARHMSEIQVSIIHRIWRSGIVAGCVERAEV